MVRLFAALAGLITPIRITAPLYLARCLERQGIKPGQMPRECITELALARVRVTKMVASVTRESWRANVTDDLELEAMAVAYLLRPDVPYNETLEGITEEPRATLLRHGVAVREIATR
jgi:hypothetical protein